MKKILIMGLSGSGKSTIAKEILALLLQEGKSVKYLNGDTLRKKFHDWDFSEEGRLRQAQRMKSLAEDSIDDFVLCDFIAPLEKMRDILKPDVVIWMDTIEKSSYIDTDAIFQFPETYDLRVKDKEYKKYGKEIFQLILTKE